MLMTKEILEIYLQHLPIGTDDWKQAIKECEETLNNSDHITTLVAIPGSPSLEEKVQSSPKSIPDLTSKLQEKALLENDIRNNINDLYQDILILTKINSIIAKLPTSQQKIIDRYYCCQESYDIIASRFQVSRSSIGRELKQAKETIIYRYNLTSPLKTVPLTKVQTTTVNADPK